MQTIVWDIETRSTVNLRDCGASIYAADPSTQIVCLVYCIDQGEPQLWLPANSPSELPSNPPPSVFFDIAADPDPSKWRLISHGYFEQEIAARVLAPRYGFPAIPLKVQHCSQRLALANTYPAELDLLAQALGLPYRKDPAARKAMLAVSRPKQQRKRKVTTVPVYDEDPAKLQLTYERCVLDVITTRAVWQSPKLKHLSATERHYQLQDMVINARGVRCYRTFVAAAKELAIHERIAINLKLQELTQGGIQSVDQVAVIKAAVNARGHRMTTLDKHAVAQVLAGRPDNFVQQLLELRQTGARAAVRNFKRLEAHSSLADDRIRQHLRMYGAGPGRWSSPSAQLQNLKKNETNLPLSIVDAIRRGDRDELARYGNPLALLGDVSRAALCAALGMELMSGDLSAVQSIILAWVANEGWKLTAYKTFQQTGDTALEPYRVIARRMLQKPADAPIEGAERQLGKAGELASGFGGSVGAWRRQVHNDPRSDDEIKAIIQQWRDAHPATRKFWTDVARAIRITIRTSQPILVAPPPQPPIVAAFADGNLTLTLPSGRAITYPEARFIPSKYEDGPPDVQFMDNARGQWKPCRGWFGTFVENIVQGIERDLLAAAIERLETRGIPVVHHNHDEVTVEVPIGSLPDTEFLEILLKPPAWMDGLMPLPLAGKVHSGAHYLAPPEHPAQPREDVLEQTIDLYLDDTRADIGPIDDPVLVEREDDEDFVANLADNTAPLTELVKLPLTPDSKVSCPFHDDAEPSCAIYPDHYHCFGCHAHGNRLDWLTQIEGMTEAEAIALIKDWTGPQTSLPQNGDDEAAKLAFIKSIWIAAQPLAGSIAEQYLDETRHIDVTKLPADIHRSLRFHPACIFGPGTHRPCLIALMRDPLSDEPLGIQRIALEDRGGKINKLDRRMLGHAGVVKIWPAGPQLVVGEGLETVLAAATRIPYQGAPLVPAWAALSSKKLATLPVIPNVARLVLLIDNDRNQEGQQAAAQVTAYWRAQGRTVVPLMPPQPGTDFNDLILGEDSHVAA
jgi:DNA polymerase